MRSLFEPSIHMGIGTGMSAANSHGNLWVKAPEGERIRSKKVYFRVDKPKFIENGLSYRAWASLLKQARKMGLDPTHIEITAGEFQYNYDAVRYREIYSNAVGMSIARTTL